MKPEKWTSADFLELSPIGRLCFEYLMEMCDDEGLIKAGVRSLRVTACNNIHEGRFDPSPYEEIQEQIGIMVRQRMIVTYSFGVDDYVWVVNFCEHQTIDRSSTTILPRPPQTVVETVVRDCNVPDGVQAIIARWYPAIYSTNNPEETRGIAPGSGSGSNTSSLRSDVSPPPPTAVKVVRPPAEPPRADVERICQRMEELNLERDAGRYRTTSEWRKDARLLLDRDGRAEDEVIAVMEWACRDRFWRRNILSVPKLREHWTKLVMARADERPAESQALQARTGVGPSKHPVDVRVQQLDARARAKRAAGMAAQGG